MYSCMKNELAGMIQMKQTGRNGLRGMGCVWEDEDG